MPSLLIPTRRIVVPPRAPLRHRPDCPTRHPRFRHKPGCPRYRVPARAAAGDVLLDHNGNRVLDEHGFVKLAPCTCCGCLNTGCAECPGGGNNASGSMLVTLAGVTALGCCAPSPYATGIQLIGWSGGFTGLSVSGLSHQTCTGYDPSYCRWVGGNASSSVRVDFCNGGFGTASTGYVVYLYRHSGLWELIIMGGSLGSKAGLLFYGRLTTANCAPPFSITNEISSCTTFTFPYSHCVTGPFNHEPNGTSDTVASGGSATITCP